MGVYWKGNWAWRGAAIANDYCVDLLIILKIIDDFF